MERPALDGSELIFPCTLVQRARSTLAHGFVVFGAPLRIASACTVCRRAAPARTAWTPNFVEVLRPVLVAQLPFRLLVLAFHVQSVVLLDLAHLAHRARVGSHVDGPGLLFAARWFLTPPLHVVWPSAPFVLTPLLAPLPHLLLAGPVADTETVVPFVAVWPPEHQEEHEVPVTGAHAAAGLLLLVLVLLPDGGQAAWSAQ